MLENLEVYFEPLWNAWSSTMVNREKRENDFTFTYALIYRGTVLIQLKRGAITNKKQTEKNQPIIYIHLAPNQYK